jgi:hypothetical protein
MVPLAARVHPATSRLKPGVARRDLHVELGTILGAGPPIRTRKAAVAERSCDARWGTASVSSWEDTRHILLPEEHLQPGVEVSDQRLAPRPPARVVGEQDG